MNRLTFGRRRRVTGAVAFVVLLGLGMAVRAQTIHLTGQNVQAVFEGWERNADGTFTMIFGYLNRNYEEEPYIPVGPNNSFSPGAADRGQPTHFYPRRQSFQFRVTVPADWGDQKLVWTLNHNGKPTTAVGKLMPVWEVDEGVWNATRLGSVAGVTPGGNAPPSVKVQGADTATAAVGQGVALSVTASDDGKPGPQKGPAPAAPAPTGGAREEAPLTTTGLPARTIGRNNPYLPRDRVDFVDARATGLAVTWVQWRGPGTVTFEPTVVPIKGQGASLSGTAKTTARFSEPGTYVIRAYADEGIQTRYADVTVTVTAGAATR
jgi:hypothetical protein